MKNRKLLLFLAASLLSAHAHSRRGGAVCRHQCDVIRPVIRCSISNPTYESAQKLSLADDIIALNDLQQCFSTLGGSLVFSGIVKSGSPHKDTEIKLLPGPNHISGLSIYCANSLSDSLDKLISRGANYLGSSSGSQAEISSIDLNRYKFSKEKISFTYQERMWGLTPRSHGHEISFIAQAAKGVEGKLALVSNSTGQRLAAFDIQNCKRVSASEGKAAEYKNFPAYFLRISREGIRHHGKTPPEQAFWNFLKGFGAIFDREVDWIE